jgi:hypothetical protein
MALLRRGRHFGHSQLVLMLIAGAAWIVIAVVVVILRMVELLAEAFQYFRGLYRHKFCALIEQGPRQDRHPSKNIRQRCDPVQKFLGWVIRRCRGVFKDPSDQTAHGLDTSAIRQFGVVCASKKAKRGEDSIVIVIVRRLWDLSHGGTVA